MKNKKKICIFCSSSNFLDESYYKDARELGRLIGEEGFDVVYGGSSLGMMWACAGEAGKFGAEIFGIIPQKLYDMDLPSDDSVNLTVTPCMRTRKDKLDKLSDCVIALAGGFGTLEELSEMIVQKQLGYSNKPIVILNTNGFYDKLIEFFERMFEDKFANSNFRTSYFIAKTPKEAVEYIKNYDYSTPVVTKTKEDLCNVK